MRHCCASTIPLPQGFTERATTIAQRRRNTPEYACHHRHGRSHGKHAPVERGIKAYGIVDREDRLGSLDIQGGVLFGTTFREAEMARKATAGSKKQKAQPTAAKPDGRVQPQEVEQEKLLQVQMAMQRENQVFTTVSNVQKTKHETAKNSIGNIR